MRLTCCSSCSFLCVEGLKGWGTWVPFLQLIAACVCVRVVQDVGVGMLIQLLNMEGSHTPGFASAAITQIDAVLTSMVAGAGATAASTCPLFPQ